MNKLYFDFLKMKKFFFERQREYVLYDVTPLSYRDAYSDYCSVDRFKDAFALNFNWNNSENPDLYGIDPYDSFVFSIHCIYYDDRIELTDGNRTWECGVEAYEGTGLFATYFDSVEEFVNRHGYSFSDKARQETVIRKTTDIDSFARDAIELVRIMLLINRIDEEPPYIHEDNPIVLRDISALEKSWLTHVSTRPIKSNAPTVIDLTHNVKEGMPVYPGDKAPSITVEGDYSQHEPRITDIRINSHTGTHIDAPSHFFEGARTISDCTVDYYMGTAIVIDCSCLCNEEYITSEHILKYRDKLDKVDILLFYTGWDKKWGSDEYFSGYPTLDTWATALISKHGIRVLGFDTPSPDPPDDSRHFRHNQILSNNNIFIIENLKNLDLLGDELVKFIALPLKIQYADGAPVRAIAIKEQ